MRMIFRCFALATAICLSCLASSRAPVIVELFTSEGCSSCPPADAVLARLARTQPVGNARVIALSEHVDYWNNLGWADPFSSPQFRARQTDYAQAFGVESIYTPQMIVNGLVQFVGDDLNRAETEIGRVASQPLADVRIQGTRNAKDPEIMDLTVSVRGLPAIRAGAPPGLAPLAVFLAITEDNLSSDVQRGENSGRHLRHAAVVRSFGVIGNIDPRHQSEAGLRPSIKLPPQWKRQDLHAVVFVQERATRRILGADSIECN